MERMQKLRTNEYDVNIYVFDGNVNLYCYPMGVDNTGEFVHTDTTVEPITLSIPLATTDADLQLINEYLLGENYWDVSHDFLDEGHDWTEWWEEHDEWSGTRHMLNGPKMLSAWIQGLPFYDAPVTEQRGF